LSYFYKTKYPIAYQMISQKQYKILSEQLLIFNGKYPDYKVIYLTVTGSKLFGLHSESSDTDIKGIFIPSKRDILLNKMIDSYGYNTSVDTKNTSDDLDLTLFSIYHFCHNLGKNESNTLDMYFSMFSENENTILLETDESKLIKSRKIDIISQNVNSTINFAKNLYNRYQKMGEKLNDIQILKTVIQGCFNERYEQTKGYTYGGYIEGCLPQINTLICNGKLTKTSISESTKEIIIADKRFEYRTLNVNTLGRLNKMEAIFGKRAVESKTKLDYKAISHAVRMSYQAIEFLSDYHITFPIKHADTVKKIKQGAMDFEEINTIISRNLKQVEQLKTPENQSNLHTMKPIETLIIQLAMCAN
jgi:predicted nucleotidyltransferase